MWRRYWWWKRTTNDYPKTLTIKFLKKYWYLDKWVNYKDWVLFWSLNWEDMWNIWLEVEKFETIWYVRVFFTQTDYDWIKKELDYKINLVSTPCNYWWVRWWFECPCKWNRCSILYLQNNWIFASRKTLDLCYYEQRKSKSRRRLWLIMWDIYFKIYDIAETIKYPYRNWKPTRKMKRILRYTEKSKNIKKYLEMFV